MHGGRAPQCKPSQNNHGLAFFLVRAACHEEGAHRPLIQSGLLPQAPKEGPVVTRPADPALLRGRWVTEALPPPVLPSPPWCSFMAGIWKLFLFTQHPQDAAAHCSSERKPWIPRRAVAEAACKAASCFAGSVWACYISVAICANRSSWCVGLRSGWGAALRRGGRVSVTVLCPHACPPALVFRARLLPVV